MSESNRENRPVEPWELSGLLDGELTPERVARVRAALESDPALRTEWETLSRLNKEWSETAGEAALGVRVNLRMSRWPQVAVVVVGILLLMVRFVSKFTAPTIGLLMQGTTLALSLVVAIALVNKAEAATAIRTASPRPSSRPA